jgi:hypothetical protein
MTNPQGENYAMIHRALFLSLASIAGLSLCPRLIAAWKQRQERQRWERLLAYGQARMRTRLRAEGLDPDRMTDDEVEAYVDRVIHEHRAEQRRKQQAQAMRG